MNGSFVLTWQGITVERTTGPLWRKAKKTLLNNVSGEAKNGTFVAIMGPSGAGKTTLLATLGGRIYDKKGVVSINGTNLSSTKLKSISGYLNQHFVVIDSLTVAEHLKFTATLKSNSTQIIQNLIVDLKLDSCKNTQIRNLSGGERKKLALACELLGDPMILFCDEPTTGLDSFNATSVIKKLNKKVLEGKLVIATIHQPSPQLYHYFNDIILMGSGKIIMQGDKIQFNSFLAKMDLKRPLITTDEPERNNWDFLPFKQLQEWSNTSTNFNNNGTHKTSRILNNADYFPTRMHQRCVIIQIYWLLWRIWIDGVRNLKQQAVHFGLLVITASIIAAVYKNLSLSDENSVQNFKGLLFFITSELIFTHLYSVIYTFPAEYTVYLQEEHLYSSYGYFISKVFSIIPTAILRSFVFLFIVNSQVQFPGGFHQLFEMWLVLSMGSIAASSFGLCTSASFQTLESIELIVVPIDVLSILLAGILAKITSIPSFLRWLKYLTPFYYVYETLSILLWHDVTDLSCRNETVLPCYRNGNEVLEDFGFNTSYFKVTTNLCCMGLLILGFCLVGYFGIIFKQKRSM